MFRDFQIEENDAEMVTWTRAECRYMLWGMMTAPTIPTAWETAPTGTEGTANP
jgi:hypothetical protein